MSVPQPISNQQTVGNIGLFYVCYRLSCLGWNVMPTARNAKGIDIVIYSQDAIQKHTIQVKTLSKGNPVPLSNKLDRLFGDFVVVCRHVIRITPECFILTPDEVRQLAHRGEKDGKVSYWLQPRDYGTDAFREKWDRIGSGLLPSIPPVPLQAVPIQLGIAASQAVLPAVGDNSDSGTASDGSI
jgi:hypothetical protein